MTSDELYTQRTHINELDEHWQMARQSADEVTGKRLDTISELTQIVKAVVSRADSESLINLLYAITDGALPLTDTELNTLTDVARDVQERAA